MKKIADKIFGSPHYLRELLYGARLAAVLQLAAALFFVWFSRSGGPLGCLEVALALNESAAVTLTLAVASRLLLHFLRRCGMKV